jgi:hypothetical protein
VATQAGLVRRALTGFLIMVPLALLALDYVRHPVVWTGCSGMPDVTEDAMFASPSVVLGTLLGHRITAALDDMGDSKFLAGAERTPYALVTTEFFQDPLRPEQGMVTRAILGRLEQLSPQHHDKLRHQLNNPANLAAGKVVSVALDLPPEQAARFPVSRIYIVMIQYKAGEGGHANDGRIIRAGLKEIMRRAKQDRVVRLLVPSLGVNWQEAGWLTHEEFFPIVFESLDAVAGPDLIRLSLYSSTPANVLQRAINAINAAWKERCAIASGKDVLFEQTTRVVLLFLLVCLVVSAFHAPLTVKNGVVIATAFIGSALGGIKLLDELIPDYGSPVTRLAIHSCVLGILALCYPSLVRASAKEIFTEAEKQ